jgi:hypothetical protein
VPQLYAGGFRAKSGTGGHLALGPGFERPKPQRTDGGDAGNRTRVHYSEPQSSTGVAYETVLLGPALCHKHLARQAQYQ